MKKLITIFKRNRNFALLLIFTGIVLFFTLKDEFFTIMHEILTLNPIWVFVGFLFMLTFTTFRAIGSKILINQKYPKFKFASAFMMLLSSQFFNAITPYAVGGHPISVRIMHKEKIKISDGTNYTVQMFLVYQISLVILQTISIFIIYSFDLYGSDVFVNMMGLAGWALDVLIVIVLFVLSFARKLNIMVASLIIKLMSKLKMIKDKEEKLEIWEGILNEFHANAQELLKDKKKFCLSILCHIIGILALYLVPLFVLFATGDYTSFGPITCIATVACIVMIGDLFPTPGGVGGVEYGFTSLFGAYVAGPTLAVIMLVWRFITYYLNIIMGSVAFNILELDNGKTEE